MKIKRLAIFIALAHASGAFANDAATADTLDEVVVRGTRIEAPQAVGAYRV